jgi:hypothetical protein
MIRVEEGEGRNEGGARKERTRMGREGGAARRSEEGTVGEERQRMKGGRCCVQVQDLD